jgi:hypothetical protein
MRRRLPAGTFLADPISHAWGTTKNDGDQIAVMFEIVDGEYAGFQITWYGFFTDKTAARTLEALRYCGWGGDDLSRLQQDGFGTSRVSIVIEEERSDKDGQMYPRVRWVNRVGGAGKIKMERPLGEDRLRMLAAQYKVEAQRIAPVPATPRTRIINEGSQAPSEGQRSQTRHEDPRRGFEPPPREDDDIPF